MPYVSSFGDTGHSDFKHFKLFGRNYFFSSIWDNALEYNYGAIYHYDDRIEDTREYWHRVLPGIYKNL